MAIFTVGFNPAIDRILECADFHVGGHQSAHQIARLAAGKAANVSRGLALLSTDSIATGFVGALDLEFFHDQLMSAGPGRILCRFVEVTGSTRENISILDPNRKLETHLRDRGFNVSKEEADLLAKRLVHDVRAGDFVVFSGSLCGGLIADYFVSLIKRCLKTGAKVVVDSSGETLKPAVQQQLWLLKPNLQELRDLLGRDVPNALTEIRDAARELLPTVQHVLVSRGPCGAILVTRKGSWSARISTPLPIIRTVGCGDHLLAGFIAEVTAGRDLQPALRTAVAVASARAVSSDMSEFDPRTLKTCLDDIVVEAI